MKINTKAALVTAFLVCSSLAPSNAVTPTLTWEIDVSGGVKTYTYTLLNDAGLGPIRGLIIYMPVAGSSSITSFNCSNPTFQASISPGLAELEGWGELDDGESMQIWLQTPAEVPTIYDYNYWSWGNPGNWFSTNEYDTEPGGTSIPVPGAVPEPSSLLALGCGLAGLRVLTRRRR